MTKPAGVKLLNMINSPLGILLLISIVKIFERKTGYRIAKTLGSFLASRRKSSLVRAVRSNQWVSSGCSITGNELDSLTRSVIINHGYCLFDFYKFYNDPEKINEIFTIDEKFLKVIETSRSQSSPQILVMPHYSNYELAARSAAIHGLTMQVLSYPNPGISYQWQNNYRNYKGIEITPISITSLRYAFDRLRNGGTVFTGIDRPYGNSTCHPVFFGKPSQLPTGYLQLALRSGAPLFVILCRTISIGKYQLSVSDPIHMVRYNDPVEEERINAEVVLKQVEQLIKTDSAQWSMFYPVWPNIEPDYESMEVNNG